MLLLLLLELAGVLAEVQIARDVELGLADLGLLRLLYDRYRHWDD